MSWLPGNFTTEHAEIAEDKLGWIGQFLVRCCIEPAAC
jgi:hypothetical protein